MTSDPVEAVIAAFLDHLENGGPAPSLDHLNEEDHRQAQELIELMREGRGIDVYRSRPSLNTLLAGTEFEGWLDPPATEGLSLDAIRADVISSLGSFSAPIADGAAENEGVRSNAVIRFGSLRIRIQFRDDITDPADLAQIDPRAAAGPAFGRFPDTAVVVPVIGDPEFSSVAIGPFDIDDFIGAPDGETHPPRITGPVLPLYDTLRRVVDELARDLTVDDLGDGHETVDLDDIIRTVCGMACDAIVAEGNKSRTDAKKEEWPSFDELPLLAGLVEDAAGDRLTEADITERINAAVAA